MEAAGEKTQPSPGQQGAEGLGDRPKSDEEMAQTRRDHEE